MKKINTVRFGELEIEEDKIVQFDEGIPAFEDEHEFVLLPYESDSPYTFLQSVNTPELAFMMGVPFVFFPDYEFQLEDEIAKKLGIMTEGSRIIVDDKMATNVPGVYAAGDCTGGLLQVSKAVADGAIAATSAIKYLRG